ncbi:MAG: site-specific integrase [Sphaerochaetaceae bacterium]|nr:site-specific integrase [Sphaerochaetaceae bacterium]
MQNKRGKPMPRKKQETYEIFRRTLPNGNESKQFYARIQDENGKRRYVALGENKKLAKTKLSEVLIEVQKKKDALSTAKEETQTRTTFLEYVENSHFLGNKERGKRLEEKPDYLLNPLFLRAKNSSRERYGITRARCVNNLLRRLLIECNDELGSLQYNKITKKDVIALYFRLETGSLSDNFKTPSIKNALLDCLSSIYGYLMETEPEVEYNPFRTIKRFSENEKIREPLNRSQIQFLFASEQEINYKYRNQKITEEKETRQKAIEKIQVKDISENEKKSFITMIEKQSDSRIEKIKREPNFTDTPFYLFFLFCLATGCRKGEARALKYSSFKDFPWLRIERSFNTERNNIEDIGLPKMKKQRIIYLCETLQRKLSFCKPVLTSIQNNTLVYTKPENAFVFSEDKEGRFPLGITQLWNHWNTFSEAMGFTDNRITFHTLRHSFEATLDSEPNIKEAWIAKYCGWDNPNESPVQRNYRRTKNIFEKDANLILVADAVERIYFQSRVSDF